MKKTKRVHPGYKEWNEGMGKEMGFRQIFGKWQYIYEDGNNRISLVEFVNNFYEPNNREICCLEGSLFDDIEQYPTRDEAEKRIRSLFGEESH